MLASVTSVAIPALLALVMAALTVAGLLRSRAASRVIDLPNHRSLHVAPTPRIGGIGILTGIAAGCLYAGSATNTLVTAGLVLLIGISILDDLYNLRVVWRMLAHLTSAGLAATAFLYEAHGGWVVVIATLAITWMINLYNFMDGSDGLAGGMAVFGFGSYGIAAFCMQDLALATATLSIAGAAAGFLVFNFPPARVFMGDAGAIPLGFLAAVCGIAGWQRDTWPLWFAVTVFSPFVVDASLTLLRRLARGAKVWEAHREHYYQRLVQAGWGHRKTLLAEFMLMTVICTAALAGLRLPAEMQAVLVAGISALFILLIILLERKLGANATSHV